MDEKRENITTIRKHMHCEDDEVERIVNRICMLHRLGLRYRIINEGDNVYLEVRNG